MLRAVYRDRSLWVVHHGRPEGEARVLARWYELHMNGWPVSGSDPQIHQYGHIDPGPGIYTWIPDIAVDSAGNASFAYARSAADELPSVGRAYRRANDQPGTLAGYAVVKESELPPHSGGHQWALYSSIGADPAAAGRFIGGGTYRLPTGFGGGYTLGMWVAPFSVSRLGDLNCDGTIDFGDINPFVLALSDPEEYKRQFPSCDINLADCNGDGQIDFGDINPFVELLTGE